MKTDTAIDFWIHNGLSVFLLFPVTDGAKQWISENIEPDAPRIGLGVAVEPPYLPAILEGIESDGLTVA